MPYRLVGHAEDRIDTVLLESARRWGIPAAARYHRLILAAASAVSETHEFAGSQQVPRLAGVRTLHLRFARKLVASDDRVADPRRLLVSRVEEDGMVEILSVVHDRMLLPRAARQALRDAEGPSG